MSSQSSHGSYLVLARKYRPQVFEDVVGQEGVTRTLANAVSAGRVAHAYLFCGPRGVGKTTAARILAKALNCEKGPTPVPCNACARCLEVLEGRSLDVLEIDGASNRGIDEVRDLRESTKYAPARARYKVYIIDEVHMLTKEAFNALLKTLEEPPPHVIFVFATTEPFSVPATILSRCQRFDFARIPARTIATHLGALAAREGLEAHPDALALIARRARGGLRDALSLLDQVIPAAQGPVTRPVVEDILGLVGGEALYGMVDALADEDTAGLLRRFDALYARGLDLRELAEALTVHLRDLLLLRIDPSLAELVEAPESEIPELRRQAGRFDRDVLSDLVDRAAEIKGTLRRNEHPRLTMELALAEMAAAARRVPLSEIARRLVALEERLGGASPAPPTSPGAGAAKRGPASQVSEPGVKESPPRKSGSADTGPSDRGAAAVWDDCLTAIKEKSIRLWGTLQKAEAVALVEGAPGAPGELVLRVESDFVKQSLRDPETIRILSEALTEGGMPHRVTLEGEHQPASRGTAPSPAPRPAEAEPRTEPPLRTEKSVGQIFKDEPMLQKALDMFDGEVLP
jgi:DNA polymerase-3 subunit gamma/tau